jgi:hypothetical protein
MSTRSLSGDGMRVFGDMVLSAQRPRILLNAFRDGRVPADDLPELIAFAWLWSDEPTSDVSRRDWLEIFEVVRFFSYPLYHSQPATTITVYRGTTEDRLRGMSWAEDPDVARILGRRHGWHGPASLYSATIEPAGVLAYLSRQGEGWTVVIDPTRLEDFQRLESLPDPHPPRN